MTRPRLPALEPLACLSCGGIRWPVAHGRCELCAAAFGPSSAPEHVATILPRVLAALTPAATEAR